MKHIAFYLISALKNTGGILEGNAATELQRLYEVEKKYHESVGGFKRDLAEKLEQQRTKNERLQKENRELLEALLEMSNNTKTVQIPCKLSACN